MDKIISITGREVLNAKGKPTVECSVLTQSGIVATATVPSGASTGKHEVFELYDGGSRYRGFGTKTAANNISTVLNDCIAGMDVTDQRGIDNTMIALDGTKRKERLGGNAILAVSVAVCRAGALSAKQELYNYIAPKHTKKIPNIIATVIAGGEFSPSSLEFEDYLYILSGFDSFDQELEALSQLRYCLEQKLVADFGVFPEDGGALAPPLTTTTQAFDYMMAIVNQCGYAGKVTLGLDVAAGELYDQDSQTYKLSGRTLDKDQLLDYYLTLAKNYPLTYIEDPFDQDDFAQFTALKHKLPDHVQVVGDDLFVTDTQRLKMGKDLDSANGLLLKINQIGTVSEALDAAYLSMDYGYDVIVSLRSGETTDDFIADLAVSIAARQIKLGSPVRAERTAKYNRLLKIAQTVV